MSHAGTILGITELEVERVDRTDNIRFMRDLRNALIASTAVILRSRSKPPMKGH